MDKTREKNGFTLIELMIVLLILGILAGIAIPSFLGQREKAKIRMIEMSAKSSVPELQSLINAILLREAVVALDAAGNEICYEPTGGGNCASLYPGVPVSSAIHLDDITDVIDITIVHHWGREDKSPYGGNADLFETGPDSGGPSAAGVVYISNSDDYTIRVRGYGATTSQVLVNTVVSRR